ncbi:hypothetical protein KGF56_000437 [Candida oxycetoniae]|uniref:peptidyl-tRNA hydrolase n=1 Tax=Candida oxycetoniae TaxID=497107 RepID=A0AAI9WZX7_9ASCO|nr:uncharacterized protein KGF56_000437 [Candida oxycetoniae]KAI3406832.1 hypothetical protein KGF56_000437 [Candida oxycetoniae]
MNIQGRTIQKHFQKFDKESHLLILHDEIELTLGKFQFRKPGSSSRGHNGLKSIDGVYKNKFSKLGIGVGKPNGNNIVRHVLGKFSEEELQILDYEVLPKVVEKLEDTIATTLSTLSSKATTLSSKAR